MCWWCWWWCLSLIHQGRTHKEIFEQIKSGKWGFYGEQWRAISEQAKDCVSKLLTMDWRRRLSVSEALNHPFLAAETSMQIPDTPLPEVRHTHRPHLHHRHCPPTHQPV